MDECESFYLIWGILIDFSLRHKSYNSLSAIYTVYIQSHLCYCNVTARNYKFRLFSERKILFNKMLGLSLALTFKDLSFSFSLEGARKVCSIQVCVQYSSRNKRLHHLSEN